MRGRRRRVQGNHWYGYMRVSTREQNEDRQLIALKDAGVPEKRIFLDKMSGKNFERPQYQKMLEQLDNESVLFVKSIDRLGRNYADLNEQWRIITKEKGADICVLDMPLLDTRKDKDLLGTLISDLVLSLLSYVSESERNAIKSRQAEGIAAAKLRGVKFGRPVKKMPRNFDDLVTKWENEEMSTTDIISKCGISESTFYRRLKDLREKRELDGRFIVPS